MPFLLSPLTYADIPAFAAADEAANANWPFATAQQIPGVPRHVMVEEWTREMWGKDPEMHWMKVSEEETGEFVAAALWKLPGSKTGGEGEAVEGKKVVAAEASSSTPANAAEPSKDAPPPDEKPTVNAALFAEMRRQFEAFSAEFIGSQPYAGLHVLMTDPKYQRRGAASLLVRWGCDKADELNIVSALTASAAGVKVYTNHGFEVKQTNLMDLTPYGVEGTELRRRMIRMPRTGRHLE